jgi:hypothetical protein
MFPLLNWLLGQFTSSFSGLLVGDAISDVLWNLGLGSLTEPNYISQVEDVLEEIADELALMNQALQELQEGEIQIQEEIQDSILQSALQACTSDVSTITEAFTTYTDAMQGLASKDLQETRKAASELYSLLGTDSAVNVAAAMQDVYIRMVGTSEQAGIITLQSSALIQPVLTTFASDANNLALSLGGHDFPDTSQLLYQPPALLAPVIQKQVLPLFQNILKAQTQGLLFLAAAWNGGPQQPQLVQLATDLMDEINQMEALFSEASGQALLVELIKQYGAFMSESQFNDGVGSDTLDGWSPTYVWWAFHGEWLDFLGLGGAAMQPPANPYAGMMDISTLGPNSEYANAATILWQYKSTDDYWWTVETNAEPPEYAVVQGALTLPYLSLFGSPQITPLIDQFFANLPAMNALSFNGQAGYVEVPYDTTLAMGNSLILSAWVLLDPTCGPNMKVVSSGANNAFILGIGEGDYGSDNTYRSLFPEFWDTQGDHYFFQAGIIPLGQWVELTVSYDVNGTLQGWINGQPIQNPTGNVQVGSNPLNNPGVPVILGVDSSDLQSFPFQGLLSTVAMSATGTSYMGCWPLDEGSGTLVADDSGNGNNGTVKGAAWTALTTPVGLNS